tara:strand:+ start:6910 stop:7278 length:369 start_codon:yes stop_codon:yes gene_type:complete
MGRVSCVLQEARSGGVMTKKLQQDSVWAKYDIDNDGTVSDEELDRATQMIELDLREEKQDSQRRIAWVAMSSMVLYSLLPLMPFVPEDRLSTLSSLSDMLFLSQASIIGLYFGATAYMSRKP